MKEKTAVLLLLLSCCTATAALSIDDFLGGRPLTKERVVTDLLEYYQQDRPSGIPVLDIPEPLLLPINFTTSGINIYDGLELSGLDTFRLEYVCLNATGLMATVLVRLPRIQVTGPYTADGYWSSVEGDLNITLTGLDVRVEIHLAPGYSRNLLVDNIEVIVTKEEMLLDFTETTLAISLLMSTADAFFETGIGLAIGGRTDKVKDQLNARMTAALKDKFFPEGINPVDLLVLEIKKKRLNPKFEPFNVGDKTIQLPAGITLQVSGITVSGLSSLHRTHEVSLQFIDDRLLLVLQVGCQSLSVDAEVEASLSFLPSVSSSVSLMVDGVSVWIELQQAADVTHPPFLRRLHVTLGNFRLESTGEGTINYVLEAAINGLANGLRDVITQRIEPVLHQVIQRKLNALDVEAIIKRRLNIGEAHSQ